MKLLTHNMLSSKNLLGVSVGYPFRIVAKDIRISRSEFNKDLLQRLTPKINWKVFVDAAKQIGLGKDLSDKLIDGFENDEEYLKKIHHLLLEVDIINGTLICPVTNREFPISGGVPNLL